MVNVLRQQARIDTSPTDDGRGVCLSGQEAGKPGPFPEDTTTTRLEPDLSTMKVALITPFSEGRSVS